MIERRHVLCDENTAPVTPLPFRGITVVSLEQAVSAPFTTRQLADFGARVIKIDRPRVCDFARGYDKTVLGQSSRFEWLNRSKESLTLDVKHSEAKEIAERLLSKADVFVQNLAPGAALRLGLSSEPGFRSCLFGMVRAWGEPVVAKPRKRAASKSLWQLGPAWPEWSAVSYQFPDLKTGNDFGNADR